MGSNTNILCFIHIYKVACFVFCIYQAFLMVEEYIENKDSAAVRYKTYQNIQSGPEQYPTFSFCVLGHIGTHLIEITKDKKLYDALYNHPECQDPNTIHVWCEIRLYQKMLLGIVDVIPNVTLESYDNKTVDFLRNINKWKLSTGITEMSDHISENQVRTKESEATMYISYQDGYRICVTRKNDSNLGIDHLMDAFTVPLEFLAIPDLAFEIYVHQVGGLIGQLGRGHSLKITPAMNSRAIELSNYFKETNSTVSISNEIRFKSIEILHKRNGAEMPCDENIHDNDRAYKKAVIEKAGCIPSFWKSLIQEEEDKLPPCTKTSEYQKISSFLPDVQNNKNVRNGTKLYTQPCYEMFITVTTTSRYEYTIFDEEKPHLSCIFYFEADRFKEIHNYQAFNLGEMWSQIGGFVGIFLGYSCLQVI